jgi:hypothetical protein
MGIELSGSHPTPAQKKNQSVVDGLQGLWLVKGSLRWRLDGFSDVRASFHSGILTLIGLA